MPERESRPTLTESPVVAAFLNFSDAAAAADELTKNAFAGDHINVTSSLEPDNSAQSSFRQPGRYTQDVREWLMATFREHTESELQEYETAVRAGNVLVGVNANAQMAEAVAVILNNHSPVYVRRTNTGRLKQYFAMGA